MPQRRRNVGNERRAFDAAEGTDRHAHGLDAAAASAVLQDQQIARGAWRRALPPE
jgi:hypothetical protein